MLMSWWSYLSRLDLASRPTVIRFRHLLLPFLSSLSLILFHLVHSQDQQGFISISCGANSSSVSSITGINYISDSGFVDTGTGRSILMGVSIDIPEELRNLRSFPEGERNCYNIKVESGSKYLIRLTFYYGNYDDQNKFPIFDVHFGPNFFVTVEGLSIIRSTSYEVIHIINSNGLHICFIDTGRGTPFISTIELRSLPDGIYRTQNRTLALINRVDVGNKNNQIYRYPNDIYDRIWNPDKVENDNWTIISTSSAVSNEDDKGFKVPYAVLRTAYTVKNASSPFEFRVINSYRVSQLYVYMFFAELQQLQPNQSRSFKVYLNGERFWDSDIKLDYLTDYCVSKEIPMTESATYKFELIKSEESTLPPIFNAFEIYSLLSLPESETEQNDADAIISIKSTYGVVKNWQGDPCAPKTLAWQGLNCTYDGFKPPRITGLNLSSSGLTGEITANIWNLKMLMVLDLSNNNLRGPVPDFLAEMASLRVLNLKGNNLSHQIPAELIEKQNKGSLLLSLDGDLTSSPKNNKNIAVPILSAVGGFIVLLVGIIVVIYCKQQRKKPG